MRKIKKLIKTVTISTEFQYKLSIRDGHYSWGVRERNPETYKPIETCILDKVMEVVNGEKLQGGSLKYTVTHETQYDEPVEHVYYYEASDSIFCKRRSDEWGKALIEKYNKKKEEAHGWFASVKKFFAQRDIENLKKQEHTKLFNPITFNYYLNVYWDEHVFGDNFIECRKVI